MPVRNRALPRQSQLQGGFGLVEILLALAIGSLLFLFNAQIQQQSNKDLKSKEMAESMQTFTDNATQYLLANRADLIQAMTDGTGAASWCVINANTSTGVGTTAVNTTLHTCAVDVTFMKFKKVVPSNYRETNSLNQRWTAIYRLIYEDYDNNAGTAPDSNGSVEMLVVGATNGGKEKTGDVNDTVLTATIAGFNGGYIPNGQWGACQYNGTAKRACAAGGGWNADLSKFLDTP